MYVDCPKGLKVLHFWDVGEDESLASSQIATLLLRNPHLSEFIERGYLEAQL
jgi:hypothetical protein